MNAGQERKTCIFVSFVHFCRSTHVKHATYLELDPRPDHALNVGATADRLLGGKKAKPARDVRWDDVPRVG